MRFFYGMDAPLKTMTSLFFFFFLFVFLILVIGCSTPPEPERVSITQALSSTDETDCYEKAIVPFEFEFPKDSGPHNSFKTEWWYYTGNLKTDTNRHFGYQLTFFRQALSCEQIQGTSRWRTRQLYFAHFAVTDNHDKTFVSRSRMNRQSLDIAGAHSRPYQVWVDHWRVTEKNGQLVLSAREKDISISLVLTPKKPMVYQGQKGLSRKGGDVFNASYYYSIPRLSTRGTLEMNNRQYKVRGNTWFDHEWSTSAVNKEDAGWDWFSVHLDDGRDLMVCQIRDEKGHPNGFGFGSISLMDNTYRILSEKEFTITALNYWESPLTGNRYPIKWEITLPGYDLSLTATPLIKNQEHAHLFEYWEGAVQFIGNDVAGFGYAELTGY